MLQAAGGDRKGAAIAGADDQLRRFVDGAGLPFLATNMGRGVVPDSHLRNCNAARSTALAGADVAIIFGARFVEPFLYPDQICIEINLEDKPVSSCLQQLVQSRCCHYPWSCFCNKELQVCNGRSAPE